jgi:YHS domain-containing protein
MTSRKTFLMLANVLVIFCAFFLVSCAEENKLSVNMSSQGVAIKGFDPVAYFTESKPVKGQADLHYTWMDSKWHFSCKENLEQFKMNPAKYAPQYKGYCAFALSRGDLADISPEAWEIVDGKLYLSFNLDIKNAWEQDKVNYIKKADRHWAEIEDKKI